MKFDVETSIGDGFNSFVISTTRWDISEDQFIKAFGGAIPFTKIKSMIDQTDEFKNDGIFYKEDKLSIRITHVD